MTIGNNRRTEVFLGTVIIFFVLFAYSPSIRNGFIWDDDQHVTNNSLLRNVHGLSEIWLTPTATPQYYPLVHTTFWLEYHLWGLNPLGYHIDNILIHAASSILLWRILKRLAVPGAWLAAAIWAVHPVGVESVEWITERKNVLSGLFSLAAALTYLRFETWVEIQPMPRKWKWYALSLALFLCAMFSKTVASSLPAALLLVCWWKTGRISVKTTIPLIPFFIVGISMGLFTAWLEKHHVGAQGPEWALTFGDRLLIAGRALWFYAGKIIWPVPVMFNYPRWTIDTTSWWQWLFPAAVAMVVTSLWGFRHRIGRGPVVVVLLFCGTLFPALGFVNTLPMRFSFVADHFQYLASIGLIVIAACILVRFKSYALVIFPLVLTFLTWRQVHVYRNVESLWTDTVVKNPASWQAHDFLGDCLMKSGRPNESMAHFRAAIAIKPDDDCAHISYAVVLMRTGHLDEAEAEMRKVIDLNPAHAQPHDNYGALLTRLGRLEEADMQLRIAQVLSPDDQQTPKLLASLRIAQGRPSEAIAICEKAYQIYPDSDEIHVNWGVALIALQDNSGAENQFLAALKLNPQNAGAVDGLGLTMAGRGKIDEALELFTKSIKLNPDSANTHLHMALCLPAREAIKEYRAALNIDPDLSLACNNLAWVLSVNPDPDIRNGKEAVALAEHACQLTKDRQPFYLGTLAAAYAESGRYDDAIREGTRARDMAAAGGKNDVSERNEQMLALYRSGKPYRELQ